MRQWSEESVQLRRGRENEGCDAQRSLDVERVTRWKLSVPRVGPIAGPLTVGDRIRLDVHVSIEATIVNLAIDVSNEWGGAVNSWVGRGLLMWEAGLDAAADAGVDKKWERKMNE